MTYRVFNIELETDGETVETPEELFFEVDGEYSEDVINDILVEDVSDWTGWLVNSLEYEVA
jgi:hypothetical protein